MQQPSRCGLAQNTWESSQHVQKKELGCFFFNEHLKEVREAANSKSPLEAQP